jgi:hypothetical protein
MHHWRILDTQSERNGFAVAFPSSVAVRSWSVLLTYPN